MKVRNMTSKRTGREIANQFIISGENIVAFQSYNSPIVQIDRGNKIIIVYEDYNYSRTTIKYRNQFMNDEGFRDMANSKGFEYYMNLGTIGDFLIEKNF